MVYLSSGIGLYWFIRNKLLNVFFSVELLIRRSFECYCGVHFPSCTHSGYLNYNSKRQFFPMLESEFVFVYRHYILSTDNVQGYISSSSFCCSKHVVLPLLLNEMSSLSKTIIPSNFLYHTHQVPRLKCFSSHLTFAFLHFIEARWEWSR